MGAGYIYILINPSLGKDLLKIGKTSTTPEERAKRLSSSTGVATDYYVAYEVETANCDRAERLIHKELAKYRYTNNREFFKIPLRTAISLVEKIVNETQEVSEAGVSEEESEDDKAKNLYDLAEAEFDAGAYASAIEYAKEAISIKPDWDEAYNSLGAAYLMLGLNDDAEEAIRKALSINPHSASALSNLGAIFHDAGMYDDAIETLENALRIDPHNARAYNNLAAVYVKLNQHEEAIIALKKGLKISPEDAQIHYNLAVCYCEINPPNIDAAEKHKQLLFGLDKNKADQLEKGMRYKFSSVL